MIYLGGSIGSGEVFITMAQGSVQMRCGGDGGGGGIKKRSRPAFMEPLPSFNSLSSSASSSFPLKDDAGYIGYLTDGEEEADEDSVIRRRRRKLLGSDVSFSACMLMMIIACGLLMLFLFAVSPWGIPPPRRL